MARIDFYHLQKQSLEEVLPILLSKAYSTGNRILIKTSSSEHAEQINSFLWTFNDESFIPHGTRKDGFAEQQPIWITADDENANQADFLFLINGADITAEQAQSYTRIFNIFDGNSETSLTLARQQWKKFKEKKFEVYYWQQTSRGTWEQKA